MAEKLENAHPSCCNLDSGTSVRDRVTGSRGIVLPAFYRARGVKWRAGAQAAVRKPDRMGQA